MQVWDAGEFLERAESLREEAMAASSAAIAYFTGRMTVSSIRHRPAITHYCGMCDEMMLDPCSRTIGTEGARTRACRRAHKRWQRKSRVLASSAGAVTSGHLVIPLPSAGFVSEDEWR